MRIHVEPGGVNRLKLYADNKYVMSVTYDTWYSLDFGNIEEMTDDEFNNLQFVIEGRKAYDAALRVLTRRAHSEFELRTKLKNKEFSAQCIDFAIEKCKKLGFVDDLEFGIIYATELVKNKRYGPLRVRDALYSKGLKTDDVVDAMCAIDFDSTACILEIIDKKYSDCFTNDKDRAKVARAIGRLGYTYSEFATALEVHNSTTDGIKYVI